MLIHMVQSSSSGLPGGLVCLFYTGLLEYADMFDNQGVLAGGMLILGKASELCLKEAFHLSWELKSLKTGCLQPCLESRVKEKYRDAISKGPCCSSGLRVNSLHRSSGLRVLPFFKERREGRSRWLGALPRSHSD